MKWTVTMHTVEYAPDDDDNYVNKEEKTNTFECPFEYRQDVYYVFREKKPFRKERWVARRSEVVSVWATNMFGVCLDNNEHITQDMFNRLFEDREDAIEFCLKKNNQAKVKVYD